MKKKFYRASNMLFSSLIAMLGLGACKSQKTMENEVAMPQDYGQQPVVYTRDTVVQHIEELKLVYGGPVVKRVPFDWRKASADGEGIFDVAEVMPQFPGGEYEMEQWLDSNMRYPEEALRQGVTGSVMVSFIVSATGSIDGVAVTRPTHPLLDAEAIRLVRAMPRWTPGIQDGKKVAVRYFIPVEFR